MKNSKRRARASLLAITLTACAAAAVASWAVVTSTAEAADDEEPPILIELADGEVGVLLTVLSTLEDSNGSPSASSVTVTVESSNGNYVATKDVVPLATGAVDTYLYIPLAEATNPFDIGFWGDYQAIALRGPDGPFLSPLEGTAAHHKAMPAGAPATGYQVSLGKSVLAAPPLVGTIVIQPPAVAGLRLAIADGDSNRWAPGTEHGMPWTEDLVPGTSSVPFYSWSNVGFWDCMIETDYGLPLVGESLRRGDGSVTLDVPPQLNVHVDVSLTNYPLARHAILVAPVHHQPNANAPSGSDIGFVEQHTTNSSATGKLVDGGGGTASVDLFALEEGGYLQIWGWDPALPSYVPTLLAWQQLAPEAGNHTVVF